MENIKLKLQGKGTSAYPGEGSQMSRRAPDKQHKKVPHNPTIKSASPGAQLEGVCGNGPSMENEQEDVAIHTHLQDCSRFGMIEMWWDGS